MAPTPSANRLPIDHPDYRYPESKNPYWTKIKEHAQRIYSDQATEAHRGHWRNQMPDASQAKLAASDPQKRRPLHVEIGCNAGHVSLEWAKQNPQTSFVGIDWKFKPIFRAAEKASKREIENLLFFRAHAERLPFMFAPGEIDFLALYFPDPWPKKAHWKNRFFTAQRLRAIRPLIADNGTFHIKTDHPGYFEWMEEAVSQCLDLWTIAERSTDLHRNHPNPLALEIPAVTLFEKLFIRDGIKIQSLTLTPRL